MAAKREKLYDERGYRSYKEKFASLTKENWPAVKVLEKTENLNERKPDPKILQQTSSASRVTSPFAYIGEMIKQVKEIIEELETGFRTKPSITIDITENTNMKEQTSSWFTRKNIDQAFDIVYTAQTQVRLGKVLFKLGNQVINYGQKTLENLRSEKVAKEEVDELKQDMKKLDKIGNALKESQITDKKSYRNKLIDLQISVLDLK